jgi:hypothetical protein
MGMANAKFAAPPGPAKSSKSPSAPAVDNGPDQLVFACQRKAQWQHPGECFAHIQHILLCRDIDYIQYILVGGLKPIREGVIFLCVQLQQLLASYKLRHHRRDGHHL